MLHWKSPWQWHGSAADDFAAAAGFDAALAETDVLAFAFAAPRAFAPFDFFALALAASALDASSDALGAFGALAPFAAAAAGAAGSAAGDGDGDGDGAGDGATTGGGATCDALATFAAARPRNAKPTPTAPRIRNSAAPAAMPIVFARDERGTTPSGMLACELAPS